MVKKTSEFVRGRVLEMYHFLKSSRKESKNLAQEGISVCRRTVNNIINAKEKKGRKKSSSKKQSKNPGTPLVRTKSLVNKVAKVIDCADQPRQRDLAGKYGVSQTTVAHIISMDLGMKCKKKQKTHKLTDKQAAQRLKRGPTFRRWLSQRKLPYIVTLDEMYLSTNDTTGKRDGYYETKGKPAPNEYKKKEHSGWPPKLLCAIGVCHRGSTSLRIVPQNVKMNNEVFLNEV